MVRERRNVRNGREVVRGLERNIWKDEKGIKKVTKEFEIIGFRMTNMWKQTNNPLGPLSWSLCVSVSLYTFRSMPPLFTLCLITLLPFIHSLPIIKSPNIAIQILLSIITSQFDNFLDYVAGKPYGLNQKEIKKTLKL